MVVCILYTVIRYKPRRLNKMSFLSIVPSASTLRPAFNVGCLMDIVTGTFYKGRRGENILNGGFHPLTFFQGPPHSWKTTIADYFTLTTLDRISSAEASKYCSEGTSSYTRLIEFSQRMENLKDILHGDENLTDEERRLVLTSYPIWYGEKYYDNIRDYCKQRIKSKEALLETPFLNSAGDSIKILKPLLSIIDSLSQFKIKKIEDSTLEENSVGDSENNTYFMKYGLAKKLLITQAPGISIRGGIYFIMTAHIGNVIEMGGKFDPKPIALADAKKGTKRKGVPDEWDSLPNVLFEIMDVSPCNNKEAKTGVLYPLTEEDRDKDCTDLRILTLKIVRSKHGLTAGKIKIIVSQREGVLSHLSNFHFIKEDNFGISGNNTTYHLDLLPNVNLSRTTVRGLIDNNYQLQRALELTSDLLQIKTTWAPLPHGYMCDPLTLYIDLKNMGYDWSMLLNTRNWWCFVEDEPKNLPQLTTMDLLEMRLGIYFPYFLNDDKISYRKDIKHLLNP